MGSEENYVILTFKVSTSPSSYDSLRQGPYTQPELLINK